MYYGYGYGYDSMYFLVLLAFIFSMVAQMKVSGTFKKYAKIRNRRGLTGAQVAEQMMHNAGIYDVSVQRVAGNLTDHYDPRTKTLRLSESVYDSTSVAAVGVAAHETGHAIQHDVDATNFGYPLGEIPQLGTLTFEADGNPPDSDWVYFQRRRQHIGDTGDSVLLPFRCVYDYYTACGIQRIQKGDSPAGR